ncbi:hypothetical protein DRN62_00930 [Nanoarchaeota archaeon]|nr:MAG: hypothetical protein DRN62_00930 [Nanoarchaeota archaeon]
MEDEEGERKVRVHYLRRGKGLPKRVREIYEIYDENYKEMGKHYKRLDKKVYGEDYYFLSPENLRKFLRKELNKKARVIYLSQGEKMVGFAFLLDWGDILELDEIHVKKGFRGKGYGSLLLDEVESFASERGKKVIVLETREKLVKFFEERGYVNVDVDTGEYLKEKYVLMMKTL